MTLTQLVRIGITHSSEKRGLEEVLQWLGLNQTDIDGEKLKFPPKESLEEFLRYLDGDRITVIREPPLDAEKLKPVFQWLSDMMAELAYGDKLDEIAEAFAFILDVVEPSLQD